MNKMKNFVNDFHSKTCENRKLIVAIVFFTNVIDNLLITCVVPIIPAILVTQDQQTIADCLRMQNITANSGLFTKSPVLNRSTEISFTRKLLQLSFNLETSENSRVGWILASKALVQLLANPMVGYLSNRYGNSIVMLCGTVILGISSFVYCVSSAVPGLLVARGTQGLGSAAVTVAGMSLLAERYHDDSERSRAMGIAMSGSALGVVIGYPYGGFLYSYVGSSAPFIFISILVVIDGVFIVVVIKPGLIAMKKYDGTSISVLLRDPYIIVASCAVMATTMSMSTLESTIPIWILDTMNAEKWELALVFTPDSIGYLIGTNFFGNITLRIGRWCCTMACMIVIGICLMSIPFATQVPHLIVPHFGLGLGLGITDAAIMPLLALLVDTRHTAVYGSVYAIAQLAVCLAYGLGPAVAGQIVKELGFSWYMWGLSVVIICISPICIVLRNPSIKEENKPILEDKDALQMIN